jgi:lipopolysaccharide biosynthesis regulator YciM
MYQQEHEWIKAIEVAQQLRDESHTYQHEISQFYCELATQAVTRGKLEEARQYLDAALSEHRQCARACLMLGEMAMDAGQIEAAIEYWLSMEKQDVHYLALVARQMMAGYDQLGRGEDGDALLKRLLRQHPELDVVDVVYERLTARLGVKAAYEFVRERLREHPTMPGLRKVLEAHLLVVPDDQKPELEIIIRLLNENTREHSMYYCRECGFKTRQYFWHCPACNEWETYPPVRGKQSRQP